MDKEKQNLENFEIPIVGELLTPEEIEAWDAEQIQITADLNAVFNANEEIPGFGHISTIEDAVRCLNNAVKTVTNAAKAERHSDPAPANKKSVSVTLRIPSRTLAALKRQAPKHGIGYQTLALRVLKQASREW